MESRTSLQAGNDHCVFTFDYDGINSILSVPSIKFVGLRHYSRISGQVVVGIEASDNDPINRVELYIDGVVIDDVDVIPSNPNASVTYNWNTANASNGKHMLQAKSFSVTGNVQSTWVVVRIQNGFSVLPLPTASLTALPASISAGQQSTLSWFSANADTVTISHGVGTVAAAGSAIVAPLITTTYTLTASNAAGTITRSVTVTVSTLNLPTATLTASPVSITVGQTTLLTWTSLNASTVAIDQGIGNVGSSGTRIVSPSVTTTYTLTASNSAGSVAKTLTITVMPPLSGNNITLNPAIRYQTIGRWEATSQAGQFYSNGWNNYKDTLFNLAVNDLGLNRIRLEIMSGIENPTDYFAQWRAGQLNESQYIAKAYEIVNDDANPNSTNPNGFKWSQLDSNIEALVLPMRQRLQARGETLWVNVNYVDFGSSPFEHKNTPAEYAEFVVATYQHMQSQYGFVPDSWEVVLEPDTPAASWSTSQVAQAIKAAGDRLAANGFTPNFVAPSVTAIGNAPGYITQIANTSGAMSYVKEFSYHRYADASDSQLQTLSNLATQHNKKTSMLEWIGADHNTLHQDIKQGRVSSWQQYTLAFPNEPDNGAQYYLVNDANPNNPSVTIGSRTKFLRQYFRYIRANAERIGAVANNSTFDPLAFINANGKHVVVVKAASGGAFNINGLPGGTYGIKYTTANQYDVDLSDIIVSGGQPLTTNIPNSGVITIYAK